MCAVKASASMAQLKAKEKATRRETLTVREEKEKTVREKGIREKEKGKGIKGACWTCNEIGHRAETCPKKKTAVNQVGKALEQDWEEDGF